MIYKSTHLSNVLISLEEIKSKLHYLQMISHEPTLGDVYQSNFKNLMDKIDFAKGEVSALLFSNSNTP